MEVKPIQWNIFGIIKTHYNVDESFTSHKIKSAWLHLSELFTVGRRWFSACLGQRENNLDAGFVFIDMTVL